MNRLSFRVYGDPKPGGSKRGFIITRKATGKQGVAMVDMSKNKGWKAAVKAAALESLGGRRALLEGPLRLSVTFFLRRPKKHFGTGRNASALKPDAPPAWHTQPADATKLLRSTEDALTGIAWVDDSQIADQHVRKLWSGGTHGQPGAVITVECIDDSPAEAGVYQALYGGAPM